MIIAAVRPSKIVARTKSKVVCESLAICKSPLAILNKKTPGIIDTTDAKPMAAKGMCVCRETGVRSNPTTTQATKAPAATLRPNTLSAVQRRRGDEGQAGMLCDLGGGRLGEAGGGVDARAYRRAAECQAVHAQQCSVDALQIVG